ncbi:TPA: hypothetical protein OL777_005095 [Escherichia coli]|nr:hypothetical protein [Escherichia coli]
MMLNAWHLPVPPFVKQSKDQLLITLWLTGEDPLRRFTKSAKASHKKRERKNKT